MEDVYSPIGGQTLQQQPLSPRLDSLAGKTIAESWNGDFKGDVTFPIIRKLLKTRFPGIKIVPYEKFPYLYGADSPAHQKALAAQIAAHAKALGCDALISGNGA